MSQNGEFMSVNQSEKPEINSCRRWTICTVLLTAAIFIAIASATIYKDPFYHYHGPLPQYHYPQLEYPDSNERYLNDGITRNFSYEGIITGTSMAENFKASEAEALFGVNFIKVPYSGASFKELNDNLIRAYGAGKQIKYIIRPLDYGYMVSDKDKYDETFDYPLYLYNDNPFDDISYVLNKSILLKETIPVTKVPDGMGSSVDFDSYGEWNSYYSGQFGANYVLPTYRLKDTPDPAQPFTKEDQELLLGNLRQNVTALAAEHPETTFYLFFTPYSIGYWDFLNNTGKLGWQFEMERISIEELLQYPNIRLYSFSDDFEIICDLDNYKDYLHYGEWINSRILEQMKEEKHLLTKDNYQDYLQTIQTFYTSYDYASLHN